MTSQIEVKRDALFEVFTPDGHAYRFWPDGHVEGFDKNSIVINRVPHHVNARVAKVMAAQPR